MIDYSTLDNAALNREVARRMRWIEIDDDGQTLYKTPDGYFFDAQDYAWSTDLNVAAKLPFFRREYSIHWLSSTIQFTLHKPNGDVDFCVRASTEARARVIAWLCMMDQEARE